jgi:hypothetical protein
MLLDFQESIYLNVNLPQKIVPLRTIDQPLSFLNI